MIIKNVKNERTKAKLMKRSLTIYQVILWDCSVKKKTISQSCAALISAYDNVTGVALLPL